jgi:DNA recombination protein RmuC
MNNTAQNLADALRGEQKFQGDWGELALERILEMSGLQRGVEYHVQHTIRDQAGTIFRPDVVIQLPDDKQLIIDSKVSLKAFEQYIHSETEAEKNLHLQAHLHSLKTHIKQLGEKSYDQLPGINSPEFVLLFIPLESSFALAVKTEPTLYSIAWEKRIVLVTPSTLLATLKTVESIWKQDRQTKHALEIAVQAGRMYDKFVGFVEDLELVSKKQREAQKSMDDAVKKLHIGPGNLAKSAEKLKIMGAKTKKEIPKAWQDQSEEEID